MQKRDYDNMYDKYTGSTETHQAVDEHLQQEDQLTYEEGFAAASGVRNETAETGGRVKNPELKDAPVDSQRISDHIEDENAGLADS